LGVAGSYTALAKITPLLEKRLLQSLFPSGISVIKPRARRPADIFQHPGLAQSKEWAEAL
jgi:hypothetical protein